MSESISIIFRSRHFLFLLGYSSIAIIYGILLVLGDLWIDNPIWNYLLLFLFLPVFYAAIHYSNRFYLLILLLASAFSGAVFYFSSEIALQIWKGQNNEHAGSLSALHVYLSFLPYLLVAIIIAAEMIFRKIKDMRISDEMRKKYEFIINSTEEFITLINRDYVYEAANLSYCRAHRRPHDEIVGKTVSEVWGNNAFLNVIKDKLDNCFSGHIVHEENCFEFATLGRRYFEVTYLPYFNDGTVTHAIVVSHDCTPHKRTEEALQRAHDTLQLQVSEIIEQLKTSYSILRRDMYSHKHGNQSL